MRVAIESSEAKAPGPVVNASRSSEDGPAAHRFFRFSSTFWMAPMRVRRFGQPIDSALFQA